MNADDLTDETYKAWRLLTDLPDSEAVDVIGCWAAETGYNLRMIAVDVDSEAYQPT